MTGDTPTDLHSHARVMLRRQILLLPVPVFCLVRASLLSLSPQHAHLFLSLNQSHQLGCCCISRAPMSHTEGDGDRCPISPMNALLTPCLGPRLGLCYCSSSPSPCNLHHINRTRIRFFFIHFYQQLCVCAGSQKGGTCRRESSTTSSTTTFTIRSPIPRLEPVPSAAQEETGYWSLQSLGESDKSRERTAG